jgi:hypothetical protein
MVDGLQLVSWTARRRYTMRRKVHDETNWTFCHTVSVPSGDRGRTVEGQSEA